MRIKSYYAGALCAVPAVFGAGALSNAARADSVLLDGSCGNSYGQTYFSDYGSAFGGAYRPITSLLLCNATDTAGGAGTAATTTYNLAAGGFGVNLDLSRAGAESSFANFGINVYFTATNSTTSYSMSGSYAFTSPFASMQSYLLDLSAGDGVGKGFQYISQSDGMASQGRYNSGALSGLLIANHHYLWHSNASIQALSSAAGGATATGDFQLALSDAADLPTADAAVPLPSAAFGGVALLTGLGAFGGRRRRRA